MFFHFKEHIMYNVYFISISYIYLPDSLFVSQRQTTFQFIMQFLHVEYGNKALLLLLTKNKFNHRA